MSLISLHLSTMHLTSSCLQWQTFGKSLNNCFKMIHYEQNRAYWGSKDAKKSFACLSITMEILWCSDNVTVRTTFFKWQVTHHSAAWAGLLSTAATTCAPPTDGWAQSDRTVLSACTDNVRELCFETHTRFPTASPGEGKRVCAGTQCSKY